MAGKEKLLEALLAQSAPVSQEDLVKILDEQQGAFRSTLERLRKQGAATVNEDKEWVITDAGRLELEELKTEKLASMVMEEAAATAPYEQFMDIGKSVGVSGTPQFFKAIADYVFNGGDYRDPEWIAKSLEGMAIRSDLVERWVNVWSTKPFINKEITPQLQKKMRLANMDEKEKAKVKEEEVRDYTLDDNDNPVRVGESVGQMTYKDAVELSKVRGMAKARPAGIGGTAGGNGAKSVSEQITEMVNAVDTLRGSQTPQPNYMVKPGADGSYTIETVEPGKPVIIPQPVAPAAAKKEVWVVQNGLMKKLEDGEPILITPPTPVAPAIVTKRYIYGSDGKIQEITGDQPIVIYRDSPSVAPSVPASVASLAVPTADGKTQQLTLDQLELFFKVEDWKDRRRRDEDSHQNKLDISTTFKDLLGKAAKAVEKVSGKPTAGGAA